MTGLLLLLLSTFVPQAGQVLPGTMSMPGVNGVSKGWQVDRNPDSLNYIVQITPEAIRAFAEGPDGQDLTVSVEPELIGHIGTISVRLGTAPLPQDPPLSSFRRKQALKQPSIQQLHLVRYAPQGQVLPMPAQDRAGWAQDQRTNKFAYVAQISPDALRAFILDGNEWSLPIEERVRPYIEQFTFRIGSGMLPRQDPPASAMRGNDLKAIDYLPANGQANLAGMPNRGATGTGSVMPNANDGGLGAAGMDYRPSNYNSSSTSVLPNSPTSSMGNFPNESPTMSNVVRATTRDTLGSVPTAYSNEPPRNGTLASMFNKMTNNGAGNGSMPLTNGSMPPTRPQYNDSMGYNRNPAYNDTGYMGNNAPPNYAPAPSDIYPRIASNNMGGTNQLPLGGTTSTAYGPSTQPAPIPIGLQQTNNTNFDRREVEPRKLEAVLMFVSLFLFAICLFQFIYMSGTRAKYRKLVLSKRNTLLESS
jgi:hypothetical protein